MRKFLKLGVVTAALALALAPAAQAHHVDLNRSNVACALVSNAPTITLNVVYVDFEEYNKPVHWQVSLNNSVPSGGAGVFTWPGSGTTQTLSFPVSPGAYDVQFDVYWGYGNAARLRQHVECPAPVPPPQVVCNGQMVPAGTPCAPPPPQVVVYCNGQVMPAGSPPECAPPAAPPTPPKTTPPCVSPRHARYRITVHPPNARTGYVTFRLRGPKARNVVWRINGHVHGSHRYEHRSAHGRLLTVPVWSREIWRSGLPGRYRVTAHFKTPCSRKIVKLVHDNIDP